MTEIRAVRESVEVDPALAEGLPDRIHVGDVVGGLQVPEEEAAAARAVDGVLRRLQQPGELDTQRGRVVGRSGPGQVVRITAEGRHAVAHSARIEPDPVVAGADGARDERAEHAVDQPRTPGAARVDEHDALIFIVGTVCCTLDTASWIVAPEGRA